MQPGGPGVYLMVESQTPQPGSVDVSWETDTSAYPRGGATAGPLFLSMRGTHTADRTAALESDCRTWPAGPTAPRPWTRCFCLSLTFLVCEMGMGNVSTPWVLRGVSETVGEWLSPGLAPCGHRTSVPLARPPCPSAWLK